MATVTFDKATRIYPGSDKPAVDQLDLEIKDGEFLVLVGPSGCGKSTSLRMLAGLEDVNSGRILIGDKDVTDVPPKNRDIAMVFQNYALYPHMSVRENMGFALKIAGTPKEEINKRVEEAAKILDLEPYLDRKPKALSGGQRQRVAMGRAIVRKPQVFLMDEPLSNLDAKLRVQTRTQIASLQRELGVTTVYVTHDQTEALTMGDRIAVLAGGLLQQCGTPQEMYERPANEFVAGFIGSPAMNLGTFTVEGEWAKLGPARVPVSEAARAAMTSEDGGKIKIGFRPEGLEVVSGDTEGTIPVEVDFVEELGSDAYVYGHLAGAAEGETLGSGSEGTGKQLIVRVPPRTAPARGGVLEASAIDPAVRPQDDLFRHVNGTWLANARIAADRPGISSFVVLRDAAEAACRDILDDLAARADGGTAPVTSSAKIASLYASFLDEERIEELGPAPLRDELAPVLEADDEEALARALGERITAGFMGPVAVDVDVDLNDPDHYTTWVGQSGLGLPDESYYRQDERAEVREAYTAHIARMLELAGLPERLGAEADELAARIMVLETALAAGHWDRVARRDVERMNNPRTWAELTASAPAFPWEAWRSGINRAAAAAGAAPTTLLDRAIVKQPDYLPHAARVWEESDLEDLRAWAAWHVVHGRATLLSRAFVEENFDFYSRTLQGVDELRARWKRAVGLVESAMGEALGELYVERHFPPAHKERMKALVERLIEAYRESISSLEWMSPATRERALASLILPSIASVPELTK